MANTVRCAQLTGFPDAGLRRHESKGLPFKTKRGKILLADQWRTSPFAKGAKKEKCGGSESVFCVVIKNRHGRTLPNSLD